MFVDVVNSLPIASASPLGSRVLPSPKSMTYHTEMHVVPRGHPALIRWLLAISLSGCTTSAPHPPAETGVPDARPDVDPDGGLSTDARAGSDANQDARLEATSDGCDGVNDPCVAYSCCAPFICSETQVCVTITK